MKFDQKLYQMECLKRTDICQNFHTIASGRCYCTQDDEFKGEELVRKVVAYIQERMKTLFLVNIIIKIILQLYRGTWHSARSLHPPVLGGGDRNSIKDVREILRDPQILKGRGLLCPTVGFGGGLSVAKAAPDPATSPGVNLWKALRVRTQKGLTLSKKNLLVQLFRMMKDGYCEAL